MTVRYEQFRREYTAAGLTRAMLDACPLRQFEQWLEQAIAAELKRSNRDGAGDGG